MKYFILFLIISYWSCKSKDKSLNKTTKDTLVHSISFHGKYSTDSLSKYSYVLYGRQKENRNKGKGGTGFFIRYENTLYFITADHLLSSFDQLTQEKEKPYPDTFFIKLFTKETNKDTFYPLDITTLKKITKKVPPFGGPDALVVNADKLKDYKIYSIEDFLFEYPEQVNITGSIIFGFPTNTDLDTYIKKPPSILMGGVCDNFHTSIKRTGYGNIVDTFNYRLDFLNGGGVIEGYSGSPVFIKIPEYTTHVFGGILVIGKDYEKHAYILRPHHVFNLIDDAKKHPNKIISFQ